jgi:hypothetical protein
MSYRIGLVRLIRLAAVAATIIASAGVRPAHARPQVTITTITADAPDPSAPGQNVTVHVTVSGGATLPTGTVNITGAWTNCQMTLSGGSGSCNIVFYSFGPKTITATYNGDATHATSSDTEVHEVWFKMKFLSQASNDGWVLESSENSNVGGSLNAYAATLRVGDDAQDRQYLSVLSFNTAGLPDWAVIKKVTLSVKLSSVTGTNPFGTHGFLWVASFAPYFGTAVTLAPHDFQYHHPRIFQACSIYCNTAPTRSGWYNFTFEPLSWANINKTGTSQLRVRFNAGDNDDNAADVLNLYSGNAVPANRPHIIVYYRPPAG